MFAVTYEISPFSSAVKWLQRPFQPNLTFFGRSYVILKHRGTPVCLITKGSISLEVFPVHFIVIRSCLCRMQKKRKNGYIKAIFDARPAVFRYFTTACIEIKIFYANGRHNIVFRQNILTFLKADSGEKLCNFPTIHRIIVNWIYKLNCNWWAVIKHNGTVVLLNWWAICVQKIKQVTFELM